MFVWADKRKNPCYVCANFSVCYAYGALRSRCRPYKKWMFRLYMGRKWSSLLTTLFSFLSKFTAKSGEKVSVKKRLNFNSWGNSENRIIITSDSELSCRLFCCRINMFMNIRLTINLKISPRAWCQTF